jgi:hypothetical protein
MFITTTTSSTTVIIARYKIGLAEVSSMEDPDALSYLESISMEGFSCVGVLDVDLDGSVVVGFVFDGCFIVAVAFKLVSWVVHRRGKEMVGADLELTYIFCLTCPFKK